MRKKADRVNNMYCLNQLDEEIKIIQKEIH